MVLKPLFSLWPWPSPFKHWHKNMQTWPSINKIYMIGMYASAIWTLHLYKVWLEKNSVYLVNLLNANHHFVESASMAKPNGAPFRTLAPLVNAHCNPARCAVLIRWLLAVQGFHTPCGDVDHSDSTSPVPSLSIFLPNLSFLTFRNWQMPWKPYRANNATNNIVNGTIALYKNTALTMASSPIDSSPKISHGMDNGIQSPELAHTTWTVL